METYGCFYVLGFTLTVFIELGTELHCRLLLTLDKGLLPLRYLCVCQLMVGAEGDFVTFRGESDS